MERVVHFTGPSPAWSAMRERMTAEGLSVQLRMIDGMPAFPDETPDDSWSELRFSTQAGMMTLRRHPQSVSIVVWGNATPELLSERDAVARACAAVGHASVQEP